MADAGRPVREAVVKAYGGGADCVYQYGETRPGEVLPGTLDLTFLGGSTRPEISTGRGVWEWKREE